jgi:small subunit ribosomal protein S1
LTFAQKFFTVASTTDLYEGVTEKEMYAMFDALLEKHIVKYNNGDRVVGTVVSMDKKFVYVDMGLKDYALLPREEVSLAGEHAEAVLSVGESREFLVIRACDSEVQLVLSLKALEMELAWERARQQLKANATLEVTVVGATKGGYRVDMGGLKSFLPASQTHPQYLVGELIGTVIPIKLVDVDENRNRCVCSNRRAMAENENVISTLTELKVGDVVQGYVQNVTAFGAFVDLNGMAGLLHISQISNERINNTEGIFQIGEPIKCMVLAVDKEKARLSLTTKKLEPTPGDMLRNRGLVMEKAEETAQVFRNRVAAAEAAVKASEKQNDVKISENSGEV